MSTTAAYCAVLDVVREAPPSDREAFLLDKLREAYAELLDLRAAVEPARDETPGGNEEPADECVAHVVTEFKEARERVRQLETDLDERTTALTDAHAHAEHQFETLVLERHARDEACAEVDELRRERDQFEHLKHEIKWMRVIERRGGAVYLRLPRALWQPIEGGCNCPECVRTQAPAHWDTLVVPTSKSRRRDATDTAWICHHPSDRPYPVAGTTK